MEDNITWIAKEFSSINLHERRLTDRFIKVASKLMKYPSKIINQAMGKWSEAKAAYRLFDNDNLDHDIIIKFHKENTIERINDFNDDEIFIAIQDSTTLNYTHHAKTTGLKSYNNKRAFQQQCKAFMFII